MLCQVALVSRIQAQTARFNGALSSLGGGFNYPFGLAVDSHGNVFVADQADNTVKEISVNGGYVTITTLAQATGNFLQPTGVALDSNGNVFVADQGNSAIKEILAAGGYVTVQTLAATNGNFNYPEGVAVDGSGNVFVADTNNHAVKEILASGGYVTVNTLGGTSGNFHYPGAVAVDSSDNVFVADNSYYAAKEILASSGYVTVNALGVANANLFSPNGLAVDSRGNIFVADNQHVAMEEILAPGGYVTVNAVDNGFHYITGVAVDGSGNVFLADGGASAVHEIQAAPAFTATAVGTASSTALSMIFTFETSGTMNAPAVLTQGATGLDFTDARGGSCVAGSYMAGQICTINVTFTPQVSGVRYGAVTLNNSSGVTVATGYVSGVGTGPMVSFSPYMQTMLASGLPNAQGMGLDGSGDLFVATGSGVYELVYSGGSYSSPAQLLTSAFGIPFSFVQWVAVDGAGDLYLADGGSNNRIVKETPNNGAYTESLPCSSSCQGHEIAVDGSGNLYTLSAALNGVVKLTLQSDGTYSAPVTISTIPGNNPWSVVVDASGNVFYSDQGNGCLYKLTPSDSSYTETQIDCTMNSPQGMVIDAAGNLYLTETAGDVVEYRLSSGTYTKVSTPVITGLSNSTGVWADPSGNLLVSNTGAGEITKLAFADPPTLTFASTAVSATSSDSPQTIILTNNGNAPLTFPVPATDLNPAISSGFELGNSSTCPQISLNSSAGTLAPGASCTDVLSFVPNAVGSITGALAITDDTLNASAPGYATQNVRLTGTSTLPVPTVAFSVPGHTYGDAPFAVAAASNSPGAFTYAVVSGPASLAGNTVTLTGTGTVVLQAVQAATANYAAASASATFTVAAGIPTVTFSVPGHTYGDAPFAVAAASNSPGAFTYAVVSGPASLAGNTVTLTGTGTVVLQAVQAATANYASASASATFTVAAEIPTVTFSVPGHTYGDAPFAVAAASNSPGAFTYAVVSGPASLTGNTVTLTGTGTVVLQAVQAATANYAATSASATFTVAAGIPVATFSVPGHTYGDAPFAVAAASNSPGAFTYAVVSGPASLAGNTVTLTGPGTVVLQAVQAATANYAATSASATFTVAAGIPVATFSVPGHTYGDAPFAVAAASNSPGAFTYAVVSGPASLAGNTVTLTGPGTVVLQAVQAATANYAATSASATFTVAAGIPVATFSVPGHTYGDAPFAVAAASNSPGAFTYAVVSGPASLAGNTVTLTGPGTVVLQAVQAATANYAATSASATFTVAAGIPVATFSVPGHTYGDAPFAVAAASNSPGAFTYAVVSGPASLAGNTVTLTGPGTVVLQAVQAATANYAATSASATFTVAAGIPVATFSVPGHTYGDTPFAVAAASNSPGAFTYAVVSGPASLAGNTVTLTGPGTVVLQAVQAATANYAATSASATFTVAAGIPVATFSVPGHTYGDAPFAVAAASNSPGAFTYAVVSGPASLAGNTVTLTGPGTVVLQAVQAATANYASASASATFTVAAGFNIFSGTGSGSTSSTATIVQGASATYVLSFAPSGAAIYPHELIFAVSGLPENTTAVFSPEIISAGSNGVLVTLIVQTGIKTHSPTNPRPLILPLSAVTFGMLLLPWRATKRVRSQLYSLFIATALLIMSMGAVLSLSGCGATFGDPRATSESYRLTVTATDTVTGLQRAISLTLIVR